MGYYAPSFGNLDSGWYFKTRDSRYAIERNLCLEWWNSECDNIVESHLRRYGMFIMAFDRSIKEDIRASLGKSAKFPNYFAYFFVSRILENPHLAQIYRADYLKHSNQVVVCCICEATQTYDDIHPSLIARTRRILPLCNKCWFWLARFVPLESLVSIPEDFKERVKRLSLEQQCPICNRKFIWLKKNVTYTFELPFLPSRYIEICPHCVEKAIFGGAKNINQGFELENFKKIADLLGIIPDKMGFVYDQADTLEIAIEATKLMHQIRPFRNLQKNTDHGLNS
jgi:hypothetical protein